MSKKSLAGWVFRIEVVTDKPSVTTREMCTRIVNKIRSIEDVEMVTVEELYENLKLFKNKHLNDIKLVKKVVKNI